MDAGVVIRCVAADDEKASGSVSRASSRRRQNISASCSDRIRISMSKFIWMKMGCSSLGIKTLNSFSRLDIAALKRCATPNQSFFAASGTPRLFKTPVWRTGVSASH